MTKEASGIMNMDKHAENRAWVFHALNTLQTFLDDQDYEGDHDRDLTALETKRRELQEGKYRVVFLGAFNVGKSTLINAFLEDEYLPTVLEECTTKITHVLRSDVMSFVLRMSTPAGVSELDALRGLINTSGISATVETREHESEVAVTFESTHCLELLRCLNALITVYSDIDFPQFRTLREKFHEVIVYLPNDLLQEDIALVDSPGVHSISETHRRITEEIIPNSHLVVCLLDSQNAGTEHNREFIESITKHRHRKMFFVINKSDHLNDDEIDPEGKRGPAKDLLRSLDGVVERPEIFFISSLYAMVASQLRKNRINIDDLEKNHKINVPFRVFKSIVEQENPELALADYLEVRSNFPALKARLLNYLYTENREGAVVEFVSRFVSDAAWKMYRPIEIQLEMARHIPKLGELQRRRESHETAMERNRETARILIQRYQIITDGKELEGVCYTDCRKLVEEYLGEGRVRQEISLPLRDWLERGENLKIARKQDFKPLNQQLEQSIDTYLATIQADVNEIMEEGEFLIREAVDAALEDPGNLSVPAIETGRANIIAVQAGLAKAYLGFAGIGALFGAAIGGGLGAASAIAAESGAFHLQLNEWLLRLESLMGGNYPPTIWNLTLLGAATGIPLGIVIGLFIRALRSEDLLRYMLNQRIGEKVEEVLRKEVREHLLASIEKRRESFTQAVQSAFDRTNEVLSRQINAIRSEEEALVRAQEELINRLEPKFDQLQTIEKNARAIIEASTTP